MPSVGRVAALIPLALAFVVGWQIGLLQTIWSWIERGHTPGVLEFGHLVSSKYFWLIAFGACVAWFVNRLSEEGKKRESRTLATVVVFAVVLLFVPILTWYWTPSPSSATSAAPAPAPIAARCRPFSRTETRSCLLTEAWSRIAYEGPTVAGDGTFCVTYAQFGSVERRMVGENAYEVRASSGRSPVQIQYRLLSGVVRCSDPLPGPD